MKWINIKDKLPIENELILIYSDISDKSEVGYIRKSNELDEFYKQDDNNLYLVWCMELTNNLFRGICSVYRLNEMKYVFWMPFPDQPERLSEKTSKEDAIV